MNTMLTNGLPTCFNFFFSIILNKRTLIRKRPPLCPLSCHHVYVYEECLRHLSLWHKWMFAHLIVHNSVFSFVHCLTDFLSLSLHRWAICLYVSVCISNVFNLCAHWLACLWTNEPAGRTFSATPFTSIILFNLIQCAKIHIQNALWQKTQNPYIGMSWIVLGTTRINLFRSNHCYIYGFWSESKCVLWAILPRS